MKRPEVILVDIGNSRIKSNEVIDGKILEARYWESLELLNESYPQEVAFMISSVRKEPISLGRRNHFLLESRSQLPIQLNYQTVDTLGVDRIAAAVGAFTLFPSQNSLIIDMGTCVTMDVIDHRGVFQGGVIAPGLLMRMKAMSHFTDALPDISENWQAAKEEFPAKSTKGNIYNGAFQSMIHEIDGYRRQLEKKFTSINMILTGGDSHFFESKLKPPIFAGLKIVETGLYRIWKHQ